MLQQASLTGVFKVIIIILVCYYIFKVLSRIFAPLLLKYIAKKAEQKFSGYNNQPPRSQQKEGEVTIDKTPNTKTSNKNVGEYVDYEELD